MKKQPKVKILLLGTGNPFPNPDKSGSAVAILVDEEIYVVDSGPGIVRRIQAAVNAGKLKSFSYNKLNKLFLTHLHSDHTAGLPDFMLTPWVVGRKDVVHVYGPAGTAKMIKHLHEAYAEDVYVRINGLEKGNTTGYKTKVNEIKPGIVYTDDKVRIRAFRVAHGTWKNAFGFTFLIGNKKIVISGDTKYHPNVVREATGADVLIHEVINMERFNKSRYMKKFHTSTKELAQIANAAKPKKLITTHQIHWEISAKQLTKEIKDDYKGVVQYGKDLDVISV